MPEDLHPQIENCPLPDPLCEVRIEILHHAPRGQDGQKQQRGVQQAMPVVIFDVDIDCDLREIRPHGFQRRDHDAQRDTEDDLPFVRPQIMEQPLHQLAVVGFTENFFFVHASMKS